MKKVWLVAAVLVIGYVFYSNQHSPTIDPSQPPIATQRTDNADAIIVDAISRHASNLQVSGQGVVTRVLPDDNHGSRHQRFLIRLASPPKRC